MITTLLQVLSITNTFFELKFRKQLWRFLKIPAIERRSHSEVFCKKGVLEKFTKFTAKHLCQSLFFNKVAGLRPFLREHLRWLKTVEIKMLFTDMVSVSNNDVIIRKFNIPQINTNITILDRTQLECPDVQKALVFDWHESSFNSGL